MPFKKVGPNKYQSPSGNTFNKKQVDLWHANGGKFPGQKGMGEMLPASPYERDVTQYRNRGPKKEPGQW